MVLDSIVAGEEREKKEKKGDGSSIHRRAMRNKLRRPGGSLSFSA
jgi:hypothetical protein